MNEVGRSHKSPLLSSSPTIRQEDLKAENVSLRLLLARAEIDALDLLAQAGIDAKERDASDKLQKLIIEELHHRIKNTLATVSAIAYQSLRGVPDAQPAGLAIEGRLQALGRAHDLLLQGKWSSADLKSIVLGAIEPFNDANAKKFSIEGPDIQIASSAVIAIAMTLNELCTNTTKFGALSVFDGKVEIAWAIDESTEQLHLSWIEKNGPVTAAPTKRSFGTRLVESLGKQLAGDVLLTYEPQGFVYNLRAPLTSLKGGIEGGIEGGRD
jgi:two-component sensor histidine kinase